MTGKVDGSKAVVSKSGQFAASRFQRGGCDSSFGRGCVGTSCTGKGSLPYGLSSTPQEKQVKIAGEQIDKSRQKKKQLEELKYVASPVLRMHKSLEEQNVQVLFCDCQAAGYPKVGCVH